MARPEEMQPAHAPFVGAHDDETPFAGSGGDRGERRLRLRLFERIDGAAVCICVGARAVGLAIARGAAVKTGCSAEKTPSWGVSSSAWMYSCNSASEAWAAKSESAACCATHSSKSANVMRPAARCVFKHVCADMCA